MTHLTTNSTQTAILAHQHSRQILQQLGIVLWVDKNRTVLTLPATAQPVVSLANKPAKQHASQSDIVSKTNSQRGDVIDVPTVKPLTQIASIPHQSTQDKHTNQTKVALPLPNLQATQPSQLEIRFQIQAMAYRQWLIMVDVDRLDIAGRELWLSLQRAIGQAAQMHGLSCMVKKLDYPPFVDDPNANSISMANTSLKGFIFGCMRESLGLRHIAPLTSLPDYLNLQNLYQLKLHQSHQIEQMLFDKTAKQRFWQALHSSD